MTGPSETTPERIETMTSTDSQTEVLAYLAEWGEYYDTVDEIADDVLISKIEAQERVMSDPTQFPKADLGAIEAVYPAFVAVACGRLLVW